jgi:hypothetical protein
LLIKCLYGGCQKTFIEEEIKSYIDYEIFNEYRKFKFNQMKLNNNNKKYLNCPFPDCEDFIEFTNEVESDQFIRCQNGHKFCAKCKEAGWHQRKECVDVIK